MFTAFIQNTSGAVPPRIEVRSVVQYEDQGVTWISTPIPGFARSNSLMMASMPGACAGSQMPYERVVRPPAAVLSDVVPPLLHPATIGVAAASAPAISVLLRIRVSGRVDGVGVPCLSGTSS